MDSISEGACGAGILMSAIVAVADRRQKLICSPGAAAVYISVSVIINRKMMKK
jgi:hypothetical protein